MAGIVFCAKNIIVNKTRPRLCPWCLVEEMSEKQFVLFGVYVRIVLYRLLKLL